MINSHPVGAIMHDNCIFLLILFSLLQFAHYINCSIKIIIMNTIDCDCGAGGRAVKALDQRSRGLGFDSCIAGHV